jgi:anti-sigma B factor antagonist
VNATRVEEGAEYDRRVATGEMRSGVSDTGVAILDLRGEHDIYTAPALRSRLAELLEGGPGVVVDLSGASFVDSSILGALLNARQRAVEAKKGFAVCLSPASDLAVRRVFDMTGLTETLPVLASLDQAVASASSSAPTRAHDADSGD